MKDYTNSKQAMTSMQKYQPIYYLNCKCKSARVEKCKMKGSFIFKTIRIPFDPSFRDLIGDSSLCGQHIIGCATWYF